MSNNSMHYAVIKVHVTNVAAFKKAAAKMQAATLAEEGVLSCDITPLGPVSFTTFLFGSGPRWLFITKFKNISAFESHHKTAHFAEWQAEMPKFLELELIKLGEDISDKERIVNLKPCIDRPVRLSIGVTIPPANVDKFMVLASALTAASLEEEGVLHYTLCKAQPLPHAPASTSTDVEFFFVESYASEEAMNFHRGTRHVEKFMNDVKPLGALSFIVRG